MDKKKISLDTLLLLVGQTKKLEGLDLTGMDLSGMNFEGVSFDRSDLGSVNLSNALLRNASFAGSQMKSTYLDEVQANRCQFTGDGIKPYSAQKAVFDFSKWENIKEISSCNFSESSFLNAQFSSIRFSNCNFNNCDFDASTWSDVFIDQCSFQGATFNRANVRGISGYSHKYHPLDLANTEGALNFNPFTTLHKRNALDALKRSMNNSPNFSHGTDASLYRELDRFRQTIGVTHTQIAKELDIPLRTWQDWQRNPRRINGVNFQSAYYFLQKESGLK